MTLWCKCENSMRAKLYNYLREYPFSFFRKSRSGGLLSASSSRKITSDNGPKMTSSNPRIYTSNQEIANRLIITLGTVKRHVNTILAALHVSNRTQAVARARELSLL